MNLRKTRIRKKRSPPMSPPTCRHIRPAGISRQIVRVSISPRAEQHRIRLVRRQLPRHKISCDDPLRPPLIHHQIQHLMPGKHPHSAQTNLPAQRLVRTQKKLLACRPTRVKCSRNLSSTKGTICEHSPILPRKRHSLRHTLINNIYTHLRQSIHIRFTRTKISALNRVMK